MIMRRAISLLALALLTSCGDLVIPILDVRASADDSRPDASAANCASAQDLVVDEGMVVYVVHALPEQIDTSPGELEIRVSTGCEDSTITVSHSESGLALVPVSLPEGAGCGVVITTTIANATDRCVLSGAQESGSACSIVCSDAGSDTGSDTSTDSGTTG